MKRAHAALWLLGIVLCAAGSSAQARSSATPSKVSKNKGGLRESSAELSRRPARKRPPMLRVPITDAVIAGDRAPARRPPGTVSASPELENSHGRTPVGYDPSKARALAPGIAAHLARRGPRAYRHELIKVFQRFAGLAQDGFYGGSTRGALVFYGVTNPPRPFDGPVATLPYYPPDLTP